MDDNEMIWVPSPSTLVLITHVLSYKLLVSSFLLSLAFSLYCSLQLLLLAYSCVCKGSQYLSSAPEITSFFGKVAVQQSNILFGKLKIAYLDCS